MLFDVSKILLTHWCGVYSLQNNRLIGLLGVRLLPEGSRRF